LGLQNRESVGIRLRRRFSTRFFRAGDAFIKPHNLLDLFGLLQSPGDKNGRDHECM
jgi:hypothetical protein